MLCPAADFVVDFLAGGLGIGVSAVQQGDAHGDGADVQVLLVEHLYRLENFRGIDHNGCLAPFSDPVHGLEGVLPLGLDG